MTTENKGEHYCPIINGPCIRPGSPRYDLGFEHLTTTGFCGGEKPEDGICPHAKKEIIERGVEVVNLTGKYVINSNSLLVRRNDEKTITAYTKTGTRVVTLQNGN